MTNPMFNPQPNYSGVTIQIANPAVNVAQPGTGINSVGVNGGAIRTTPNGCYNNNCYTNPYYLPNNGENVQPNYQGNYINYPQGSYAGFVPNSGLNNTNVQQQIDGNPALQNTTNPLTNNPAATNGYQNAYPAQYYLNNYNYGVTGDGNQGINGTPNNVNPNNNNNPNQNVYTDGNNHNNNNIEYGKNITDNGYPNNSEYQNNVQSQDDAYSMNSYKMYAKENEPKDTDMSRSKNIIEDIDDRENELAKEKKNTKEVKIVALTDDYIKSLENYLDNPNDEIRLMASKEILTRLDEDKDRYNDAALNALLNKMMQDPNKLVRIAALSAFASKLASGNDYTVQLLHNIQSNPNADKEDVLQAADILLKMSGGVEVKNIPNPSVKDNENTNKKA